MQGKGTRELTWPPGEAATSQAPTPSSPPPPVCPRQLTTHRSHRLVSLAVRTVTLPGATSGGACNVWMTREGWLSGLGPTTFTCRIRNLERRRGAVRAVPARQTVPLFPEQEKSLNVPRRLLHARSPLCIHCWMLYGNCSQILSGIKKRNENEISLRSIRNSGICVRNLC